MKVHHRSPDGGSVVSNHPDVVAFASNSGRGGATLVLHGDDLFASTVSCSSHTDTLDWAGMQEDYFDPCVDEPEGKSFRMGVNADGLSCELWANDGTETDVFPFDVDRIERVFSYLVGHPRLRRLAARKGFDFEIVVWDGCQEARWRYDRNGLRDVIDGVELGGVRQSIGVSSA